MDAVLLDAIAGMGSRPVALKKLIDNVDFENREIPTFDQVSYGLPRLMSRGYITAMYSNERGIRLKATPAGLRLRRAAGRLRRQTSPWRWPRIGEYSAAIAQLVGAPEWPITEVGDRSVGRLPKLDREKWEQIVAEYHREGDEFIERLLNSRFFRAFRWLLRHDPRAQNDQ